MRNARAKTVAAVIVLILTLTGWSSDQGSSGSADDYHGGTSVTNGASDPGEDRVLRDASAAQTLLDRFWSAELSRIYGLTFDPPDRLEPYRGSGNTRCGNDGAEPRNAFYCFDNANEFVAFDLDWFKSYLGRHPGDATTFLILAHEWGHAVQDTWMEQQPGRDSWSPPYKKELSADCLAGVFLIDAFRRRTIIEEPGDPQAIVLWLWESGSGPWFDPVGDHGTKVQRVRAFADGVNRGTNYCRVNY